MANHKSAEKRAGQSLKRNQRNKSYLSKVKTLSKSFLAAIAEKKNEKELDSSFRKVQSVLQKAAGKGIIPRNTVARRISRLQSALKKVASK